MRFQTQVARTANVTSFIGDVDLIQLYLNFPADESNMASTIQAWLKEGDLEEDGEKGANEESTAAATEALLGKISAELAGSESTGGCAPANGNGHITFGVWINADLSNAGLEASAKR